MLPRTHLMYKIFLIAVLLLCLGVFIGASSAAVKRNEAPFVPILVVGVLMSTAASLAVFQHRRLMNQLDHLDKSAWLTALLASILFIPVGIGFLGLTELLRKDVRQGFWGKHHLPGQE